MRTPEEQAALRAGAEALKKEANTWGTATWLTDLAQRLRAHAATLERMASEGAMRCARCVSPIERVRVEGRTGGVYCSARCADESDYERGVPVERMAEDGERKPSFPLLLNREKHREECLSDSEPDLPFEVAGTAGPVDPKYVVIRELIYRRTYKLCHPDIACVLAADLAAELVVTLTERPREESQGEARKPRDPQECNHYPGQKDCLWCRTLYAGRGKPLSYPEEFAGASDPSPDAALHERARTLVFMKLSTCEDVLKAFPAGKVNYETELASWRYLARLLDEKKRIATMLNHY